MDMPGNEQSDAGHELEHHAEELRRLAERAHVDEGLVRALAGMVLGGLPDAEIYDRFRATVPSPDGQFSPLRGLPELLVEVRRAVASTT
jgi:hypothetical protein